VTPSPAQMTRRQSLNALAADVFGPGVAFACAEIANAQVSELHADEWQAIQKATKPRQREFAAGRIAARYAMGRAECIPMGEDRAPVWPSGVHGSITHAGGWAVAVAGEAGQLIGVDLELDEPLPADVLDVVLSTAERDWVDQQDFPAHWARVIFSAKECAYKAQYARSTQLFGFETFEVALNLETCEFSAVFQHDVPPFAKSAALRGRFSRCGGFIMTGVIA